MSYVVFARKYRPMFFEDVVGQQHVTQTLQNAIQQNRIANAYLFSGPRGVGKTTVARILAKALNCEKGPTITPCNACSFCREINESRSFDVLEIDGASNRGIDEVRNLREGLKYSPNPGKHRIYIIDEVHMLTNEAFNALLKTLEEPPAKVLFIFATTEAHKVPATILSRCQRFDFKRLSDRLINEQLKKLCETEQIEIDEESLRLVAMKAEGGMRDAESILDQIIAFGGLQVKSEDVINLLGIINQNLFFELTDLIKAGDVTGGIRLAQNILIEGYDFSEFLIGLAEHFRNFIIVKTTGSAEEINVSEEQRDRYVKDSGNFEVEDLLRLIKLASDTENLIRRSTNARLHLEVALVKMIKLSTSVPLSELLKQVNEIKKKPDQPQPALTSIPQTDISLSLTNVPSQSTNQTELSQSAILEEQPQEHEATGAPSGEDIVEDFKITLEMVERKWQEVLEIIKKKKIALGSFLSEGWPTDIRGNVLEVSFGANNGFHISLIERHLEFIQDVLKQVYGCLLRLRCVKDKGGVLNKVRKIPIRVDKQQEFEQLLQENKFVQTLVDTFNAELLK
jgi:DNA polymerase-3 subunit gamma/tau